MNTFFLFVLIMVGGLLIGWAVSMITSIFSRGVALHNPILPGLAALGIAVVLIQNSEFASNPDWLILSGFGLVAGLFGWCCYGVGEATRPVTTKEIRDRMYRDKRL